MKRVLFWGFLLIFGILIFVTFPVKIVLADTLVIRSNGQIELVTGKHLSGLSYLLLKPNSTGSSVLGSSSGVNITVSVSSLLPSDTPSPTPTSSPTQTPTPTGSSSSSPTNTPTSTPTSSPSPTPTTTDSLLATISNGTDTTSQEVDQVIVEQDASSSAVVITSSDKSGEITISQGDTDVTTDLPVKVNSDNSISVGKDEKTKILTPQEAIKKLQEQGTFLLANTLKTKLVEEDKKVVYKISGQAHFQILKIFTVKLPYTAVLDAATGKRLRRDYSLILRILTFLHLGRLVIK